MVKKKSITKVDVIGTEKRYEPCKHYVFIVNVTWSDGTTFPVYRKFSDFYEFQIELLDCFPAEAGVGGDRIIPFLPGVKLFGRTEIKRVADERKMHLAEYCRKLISLPEKISKDSQVLEFFEARPADINPPKSTEKKKESNGLISSLSLILPKILQKTKPAKSTSSTDSLSSTSDDLYVSGPVNFDSYYAIADYKASAKGEISLTEGQEVEVIEKNDNGWWLVSSGSDQGWAPASFLEPLNVDDPDNPEPLYLGETYVTLAAYTAELKDEISFPKGVIVEAMHKLLDGWWIISYNGDVGHAPATYLAECNNPHVDIVNTKFKKIKKPTQRRCTIKTKACKPGATRDLTLYRQLSAKNRARSPIKPPRMDAKPAVEDEVFSTEEDLYENDADVLSYQQSYSMEKSCPNRGQDIIEEPEHEGADYDDDTFYINVDGPSANTLPRTSSSGDSCQTVPNPRGETLPKLPPRKDIHHNKAPVSHAPKINTKVSTPLAFLKGTPQKNGAPKKPGNQVKGTPQKNAVTKTPGNQTKVNLAAPLNVPTRTDRSPSPRGGAKALNVPTRTDRSPSPFGGAKAQKAKKPDAGNKANQNNPGKGIMAQRIAMFEK